MTLLACSPEGSTSWALEAARCSPGRGLAGRLHSPIHIPGVLMAGLGERFVVGEEWALRSPVPHS